MYVGEWVWMCLLLCGYRMSVGVGVGCPCVCGVSMCVRGVCVWGGCFECACVYTDCNVYPLPTVCRHVVSHCTGGCLSLMHAVESHK